MDPSKTVYGERNPRSPRELGAFDFLVGRWQGTGQTRLGSGRVAEYPVSWVGRYVLDGMAIADEVRAPNQDGTPLLGITLRQYDDGRRTWVVEYINVTDSFIRKQVSGTAGSVVIDGNTVTIASESPGMSIRERYIVADRDHFVYRLDVSTDNGRSWDEGPIVMTFHRVEEPAGSLGER